MKLLQATEVFTPGEYPEYTYVERSQEGLEKRLTDALATPGEIVSISGPSKSGKTVLVERVIGIERLIPVTGAGIISPDDLWNRILDWMDAPTSRSIAISSQQTTSATAEASGGTSILGVVKGTVKGTGGLSASRGETGTELRGRQGISQVIREIGNSDFVLLVDDFHYMDRSIQTEVAKQLKEAARQRVKIIAASVPHRADDVVRSNPELRGRVRSVDLRYWPKEDLLKISQIGFQRLKLEIDMESLREFALEASGSPQLMQAICLQTCFELGVRQEQQNVVRKTLSKEQRDKIYLETSTRTDYRSLVNNMHAGPKKRGTERKEYNFIDGTKGDVYRCTLLAVTADPPSLGFDYNEIFSRIQRICKEGDLPQAASIYQSCMQISAFAKSMYPNQRVIEWAEDSSRLDIIDPYFLFYLRWSVCLSDLGNPHG